MNDVVNLAFSLFSLLECLSSELTLPASNSSALHTGQEKLYLSSLRSKAEMELITRSGILYQSATALLMCDSRC